MPFSKENQRKITRNMESIVSDLKLNSILDTLLAKEVLDLNDVEKINSKDTQSERNREFVTLLVKAKRGGYEIFIDTLKKDDAYAELAQQIEKTEVPEEIETLEDWIGEGLLTSERGQHYLKDVDLLHYSKVINPSNIKAVATCLGISDVDVQNIEYKHNRSPESMCHELLIKWRSKTGHSATVRSLLEKLFVASSINNTIYDATIREILKKH